MATVGTDFGQGGANLTPDASAGQVDLATALRDLITDLGVLRAAIVGLTAKLDADDGVTDVDYASTLDPVALISIKG